MRYFCTTPLGLESVTAEELRELGAHIIELLPGRVIFDASDRFIYSGNFRLKTINRLFIALTHERFRDLRELGSIAASISYTWIIPKGSTFAVRVERVGSHEFTSIDAARVLGASIIESYLNDTGHRLRVNLEEPDVEIHAYIVNDEVTIGVNTTGNSLHRRRYRVYDHPAALKTTLAAALARVVGFNSGNFLDPMCGGGTVAIEAAHKSIGLPNIIFRHDYAYRKLPLYSREEELDEVNRALQLITDWEKCSIYCIDISRKHLMGADINMRSAVVRHVASLIRGDATRPETYASLPDDIGFIAFNPPYGRRFHNPRKIPMLYKSLLTTLLNTYPGARISLITAAIKAMESVISDLNINVLRRINVMHGGLPARIYLLKAGT